MAGPRIPDTGEGLTAAWLREALVAGGRANCPPVRELRCEAIGEGLGLMGEILRCEATFADGAGPPESVIVKLASRKRANRRLGGRWGMYRREYNFYRHLASGVPLRTPELLYGDYDTRSHRFVLVLEDLGGMAAGDQVDGASPEQVRRAVRAAARLHGEYWNRVESLAAAGLGETLAPRLWLGLQILYLASLPRSLPRLADGWSAEVRELAEEYGFRLADHLTHLSAEPRTFVHGDYRLDNMFFGDGGRDGFAVLDWQNAAIATAPTTWPTSSRAVSRRRSATPSRKTRSASITKSCAVWAPGNSPSSAAGGSTARACWVAWCCRSSSPANWRRPRNGSCDSRT